MTWKEDDAGTRRPSPESSRRRAKASPFQHAQSFLLPPSSFLLPPSSFIPHPSSLHPSSLILHPSSFLPHPPSAGFSVHCGWAPVGSGGASLPARGSV